MKDLSENKSILIIYHSGSGSTKTISEVFYEKLSADYIVDIMEVSIDFNYDKLKNADLVLLGFPTYHCEPSQSMIDFIEKAPVLEKPVKSFIFATCGLYRGNALRMAAQKLYKKNIVPVGSATIVGPASDGVLLFPESVSRALSASLSYMLKYQRSTKKRINSAVAVIDHSLHSSKMSVSMPWYKWYVPINNIFKFFGERSYDAYKNKLHIIKERCTNCGHCVDSCERGSWSAGENCPGFSPSNCELCLRCAHHCPKRAIVISEKMKDRVRLNRAFYKELKREVVSDPGLRLRSDTGWPGK
ncbi:MAG: hypothetical protein GY754_29955 [bacterium]|nr:hypothetical protein [bacterium]